MIKPLFQKVIVAYNGSVSSLHAAMYAIMMAKVYKCHVKVVYVVDTDSIKKLTMLNFLVKEEGDRARNDLESDGERDLLYVQKLAKSKGVKLETELRHGAVWSELITAADEYKADLLLLGASAGENNSLLRRDVVSRQNGEIIGSAHCNVMVVHQPYIEQMFKLA